MWFSVIGDFFTNIAAAWVAAAFISPNFSTLTFWRDWVTLLLDIGFGILSLQAAVHLKRLSREL